MITRPLSPSRSCASYASDRKAFNLLLIFHAVASLTIGTFSCLAPHRLVTTLIGDGDHMAHEW